MSSKHPIDALFEQELKEHQSKPREAVWAKIAASQQATKSKKGGWYMLRAASVLLLLGLTSIWYFRGDTPNTSLGGELYQQEQIVAGPEGKKQNAKSEALEGEPKSEPSAKTPKNNTKAKPKTRKKAPRKQKASRVIPILQQNISEPVLALNDLQSIDWEEGLEGTEEIPNPEALKIKVKLSDLKGNYNTEAREKKDLRQRLWAYASNQYERVMAGEDLELPKTEDAKIEIPLPDFINRRFSK